MHCRSTTFKALSLACALLSAAIAQAAPKPLDDAEMSAVRGADGSILAGLTGSSTSSSTAQNPLASGLAAAFTSSTGATTLNATQFAASLEAVGLPPTIFADYAGQPVSQTVVDAKPVTFSFNASDLLLANTGLQYTGAASMGTITLKDFDARGTTIWVWHH